MSDQPPPGDNPTWVIDCPGSVRVRITQVTTRVGNLGEPEPVIENHTIIGYSTNGMLNGQQFSVIYGTLDDVTIGEFHAALDDLRR